MSAEVSRTGVAERPGLLQRSANAREVIRSEKGTLLSRWLSGRSPNFLVLVPLRVPPYESVS